MAAVRHLVFLKVDFLELWIRFRYSESVCVIMKNFVAIGQTVAQI